ncbi:TRAP transporter substrate-binding protein [Rubrivirga marina]|uniref:C4-dicarboxylate ABC transporter substrate-binding protein n=1 Tax=Rubrivirga marina TaxID=1196024 RepID=A0A271IVW2_9BACT|nr:TRAP transporter substrate-binding protein [Rubrivirga marina]PAP75386.1 C4-dicarboxylate ABC transporter substrate-binding protein [Rubrivirga marina]
MTRPRLRLASVWKRFSLVLAVALAGCAEESDVRVIRLGHALDTEHPVHLGMEAMAATLDSLSSGTMRIDIYPSQQLGSERVMLELLQIGSLGMTKVSSSVLENFAPEFRVLSLPFVFRDDAHRFAVLEGAVGDELLEAPEPYRLRGLAFYDAGSRSFYTVDTPVLEPSDLMGQKIRVQESATAMDMVRSLGGSPTPISWGELYTSLQQGVVDGAENNPPSFYLSRHYEVARYYVLNEHTAVPDVLVVGTTLWDRLSPQERGWLQEASDASAEVQKRLWREATEEALEAVEAEGVEVVTDVDKAPFAAAVQGMMTQYAQDPQIARLLDAIRTTQAPAAADSTRTAADA